MSLSTLFGIGSKPTSPASSAAPPASSSATITVPLPVHGAASTDQQPDDIISSTRTDLSVSGARSTRVAPLHADNSARDSTSADDDEQENDLEFAPSLRVKFAQECLKKAQLAYDGAAQQASTLAQQFAEVDVDDASYDELERRFQRQQTKLALLLKHLQAARDGVDAAARPASRSQPHDVHSHAPPPRPPRDSVLRNSDIPKWVPANDPSAGGKAIRASRYIRQLNDIFDYYELPSAKRLQALLLGCLHTTAEASVRHKLATSPTWVELSEWFVHTFESQTLDWVAKKALQRSKQQGMPILAYNTQYLNLIYDSNNQELLNAKSTVQHYLDSLDTAGGNKVAQFIASKSDDAPKTLAEVMDFAARLLVHEEEQRAANEAADRKLLNLPQPSKAKAKPEKQRFQYTGARCSECGWHGDHRSGCTKGPNKAQQAQQRPTPPTASAKRTQPTPSTAIDAKSVKVDKAVSKQMVAKPKPILRSARSYATYADAVTSPLQFVGLAPLSPHTASSDAPRIGELITLPLRINNKRVFALLDSGANISTMDVSAAHQLQLSMTQSTVTAIDAAASPLPIVGDTPVVEVSVHGRKSVPHVFAITQRADKDADDNTPTIVVGTDLLFRLGVSISGLPITFPPDTDNPEQSTDEWLDATSSALRHAGEAQSIGAGNVLAQLAPVIAENAALPADKPCSAPQAVMTIPLPHLKTNKSYFRPPFVGKSVDEQLKRDFVDAWLRDDFIEAVPPNEVYNTPLFLVARNGKFRPVFDATHINRDLELPPNTIPLVARTIESTRQFEFVSLLDLSQGFNQAVLAESSRDITCFRVGNQTYRWKRLPFGFSPVPAFFQTLIASIIATLDLLPHEFVCNYSDDIIITTTAGGAAAHAALVEKVIRAFTAHHLRINNDKNRIMFTQVRMLGRLVTPHAVGIASNQLEFLEDFEPPRTLAAVQSLIGSLNYLRDHIPRYEALTARLSRFKSNSDVKNWNADDDDALMTLRRVLALVPQLHHEPPPSIQLHVAHDASLDGCGAYLFYYEDNVEDDAHRRFLRFASKRFGPAQVRQSAYGRELYGLLFAINVFEPYFKFRRIQLHTDQYALTKLLDEPTKAPPTAARHIDRVLEFAPDIRHQAGSSARHLLPDALSRLLAPYDALHEAPVIGRVLATTAADRKRQREARVQPDAADLPVLTPLTHDDPGPATPQRDVQQMARRLAAVTEPPPEEQRRLVVETHNRLHQGTLHTVDAILREGYAWDTMRQDVDLQCRNCLQCLQFNVANRHFAPARSILADKPLDLVQADFCGPMPQATPCASTMLLIIHDVCTRYTWLRATSDRRADTVVKVFQAIFDDFGPPLSILTDNAPEFMSERFVLYVSHVEKASLRHSAPYQPRSNGGSEATVKQVKRLFNKLYDATQPWTHCLGAVQRALNERIMQRTGSSPFTLMFGRAPNSLAHQTVADNEQQQQQRMEALANIVWPIIRKRADTHTDAERKRTDEQRRFVLADNVNGEPAENDIVFVRNHRHSVGSPKYFGPFIAQRADPPGKRLVNLLSYPLTEESKVLKRHVPMDHLKVVRRIDFDAVNSVDGEDDVEPVVPIPPANFVDVESLSPTQFEDLMHESTAPTTADDASQPVIQDFHVEDGRFRYKVLYPDGSKTFEDEGVGLTSAAVAAYWADRVQRGASSREREEKRLERSRKRHAQQPLS